MFKYSCLSVIFQVLVLSIFVIYFAFLFFLERIGPLGDRHKRLRATHFDALAESVGIDNAQLPSRAKHHGFYVPETSEWSQLPTLGIFGRLRDCSLAAK